MKNKAVFAVLICFLMIFTILPEAAFAGEAPELSVGGWFDFPAHATTYLMPVPETTDLYTVSSYDAWTVKLDRTGDVPQLTLRGANILGENSEGSAVGIHANFDLEIILEGENFVTGGNCTGNNGGCYGINVEGNLTFSGTGSLEVKSGSFVGGASESDRACYGLLAEDIVVEGGQIVASAGEGAVTVGVGIYCKALKVKSGSISGIGGENPEQSYGIIAIEVAVPGGSVLAKAGEATAESFGLLSDSITMYGGNLASKTNAVSAGSKGAQKKLESDELPAAILNSGFDYFWRSSETGSWKSVDAYSGTTASISDKYFEIKTGGSVRICFGSSRLSLSFSRPYWKNGEAYPAAEEPAGGYNAYYDAGDGILYLNGLDISTDRLNGIEAEKDLIIVLYGKNTIKVEGKAGSGIFAGGTKKARIAGEDITIRGNGSLDITAVTGGIEGKNIKIEGGTINSSAEKGIYADGSFEASGGDVTVAGYQGIVCAGDFILSGGKIKATGKIDEAFDMGEVGIEVYGDIIISGGTVEVFGNFEALEAENLIFTGNYLDPANRKIMTGNEAPGTPWEGTDASELVKFSNEIKYVKISPTAVSMVFSTVSSPVHQIAAAAPEGEENPNTGARMPLAALSAIVLLSAAAFAAKKK